MNWIAQVFGLGAMASLFAAYQQSARKRLIFCKLCADVCWAAHYFLLGAYGGMVPNLVGIFRELVFMRREEKAWANRPWIPAAFIVANWCVGFSTFASPVNIMPIAASTFVTVSLWLKKPALTKLISVPVSLTFLIYDAFVGSYIGIVNETAAIASILIHFVRHREER